jgi:hypothetical protein
LEKHDKKVSTTGTAGGLRSPNKGVVTSPP